MNYANGDVYTGYFKDDMRHGSGRFVWAGGDVYEGTFTDNLRDGHGTYTWADSGAVYSGDFKAGERTGIGVIDYGDGSRYEGGFEKGKRTEGTYYFADGDWINGTFDDDQATGRFLYYRASDGTLDYAWYENGVFIRYMSTPDPTPAEPPATDPTEATEPSNPSSGVQPALPAP